ncbi:Protein artemis [Allomyces javanicus]|nr:Protein artemis [Allomyces javanicus]
MPNDLAFNGILHEYSFLAIDKFAAATSAEFEHLLTHAHSDHTSGIAHLPPKTKVYCTHATKTYLSIVNDPPVGHLDLVAVEYDRPFTLSSKSDPPVVVKVTFIDAFHCPGSASILIEGPNGTVLHTGDFRFDSECEAHWRRTRLKDVHVDSIYIDTTFVQYDREFPLRSESVEHAVTLAFDPTHAHYAIRRLQLGHEHLMRSIHSTHGLRTRLPPAIHRAYLSLFPPTDHVWFDPPPLPTAPHIHVCLDAACRAACYHRIAADTRSRVATGTAATGWIELKACAIHFCRIPAAMDVSAYGATTASHPGWVAAGYDADTLRVLYAQHSSRAEVVRCLAWLRPRTAVSTTVTDVEEQVDWEGVLASEAPWVAVHGKYLLAKAHGAGVGPVPRFIGLEEGEGKGDVEMDEEKGRDEVVVTPIDWPIGCPPSHPRPKRGSLFLEDPVVLSYLRSDAFRDRVPAAVQSRPSTPATANGRAGAPAAAGLHLVQLLERSVNAFRPKTVRERVDEVVEQMRRDGGRLPLWLVRRVNAPNRLSKRRRVEEIREDRGEMK